jgi:ribosomal protein S19
MEHTSDKEKATEIVMDHLSEFPDYYDRLKKMEDKAKKEFTNESRKKFIKTLLREELIKTPKQRRLINESIINGKTIINVDIQPEYDSYVTFEILLTNELASLTTASDSVQDVPLVKFSYF